jgi:hypothetical protein
MTAVLFATIFYFVVNIPGPTGDSSIHFTSTLESDGDFALGSRVWLNLTHMGGRAIPSAETEISVIVDGAGAVYGFPDGNLGLTWAVGEVWSLATVNTAATLLPAVLSTTSVVYATVADSAHNVVIWTGQVFLKLNVFGPRIDGGVDPSPPAEGDPFALWARIVELEGQEIVSATVVSVDLGILIPTNLTFNFAKDRWELPAPGGMPQGKYSFTVTATDIAGKSTTRIIYFSVGSITGAGPDVMVDPGFIIFSDESPVRGDEIVVTAVAFNLGGTAAGANCTFYLNAIAPSNVLGYVNITTIAPGGGVDAKLTWKAQPGGLHTIFISCDTYPSPTDDTDPGNNQAGRQISVLPRILLVDDDQEPDTSISSEAIYLKAALDATDFQYDVAVVGSGVGPDYDSGATPLQDYDVVVWTTGQRSSATLVASDVSKSIICGFDNGEDDVGHLTTFMCDGGRVWLVGEGILNEAGTTPWPSPARAVGFLNTYFGFTPLATPDTGAPATLQSTGTPLWNSRVIDFATSLRWSPDGTDRVTSNLVPAGAHTVLRDAAIPANAYGVNYTGLGLGGAQFRSIFMGVGFATLRDSGDQAQTAYHFLLWLSGLPKKLGHDVAISAASVTPPAPRFQQDVLFNVTVRNNGGFDEGNFEVLMTDIYQGVETQIATVTVPTIGQLGGEYRISQLWRPDRLGIHTLRAIADWNNKIVESNENNNEISSLIFTGQVVVGFNLLVVDDDNAAGALPGNSTRAIVDDIATLNLGRARPFLSYDYYTVPSGSNGPTADLMLRYNAVIWSSGQQVSTVLTAADRANLTRYLEQSPVGSHLLLVAPRIYEDVAERPLNAVFLCQKLGVDFSGGSQQVAPGAPPAYSLWGTFNDGFAHGMRLSLASGYPAGQMRRYLPCAGGAGAVHGEVAGDDYWNASAGMRHFITERHNVAFKQKGIFVSLDPAYVSTAPTAPGAFTRAELLYQAMHWLGAPDELANVRVTPPDIYVGSGYGQRIDLSNVQLSVSYVLKARIRNTGYADATGVNVRFLDSAATIAVDATDVDAAVVAGDWTVTDGVTVVEVLWTPLFAGSRSLKVVMDPLGIVPERTKVDNTATQIGQVWFFHDDLERGGSRWSHEAVVTRINGENPIDFIPPGTLANTDIPGAWDPAKSSGLVADSNVSHSAPNSYRLQEVSAPAVDVFLVFQNTNPMDSTAYDGQPKWIHAQNAMKTFVGIMRPKDRVGLIYMHKVGSTDPWIAQGLTLMNAPGKASLNSTITATVFEGGGAQKPQVDATWLGACNLLVSNIADPPATWAGNRSKAIVVVTAGTSNDDDDNPSATCLAGGGTPAHPDTGACCGTAGHRNAWAGGAPGSGVDALPFPVFVVNVNVNQANEMRSVAQGEVNITTKGSCGGFYTNDPSAQNLESIYRAIAILLTGGSQTLAPGDFNLPLAPPQCSPALKHRWIVTPPVTLDASLERATVALWHRYSMITGQNGVLAQIGLPLAGAGIASAPGTLNCPVWHDPDGDSVADACGDGAAFSRENDAIHWEYLTPSKGLYTGNLNPNVTVQWPGGVRDDDNRTMLFAWTGVSTKGTFGWEYSEIDITRFIPGPGEPSNRQMRFNFSMYQFGGGSGKGWWVDDLVIKVSRKESSEVTGGRDIWKLRCSADAAVGGPIAGRTTCAWGNQDYDPAYGGARFGYWVATRGLDNSLISTPIDLTRARFATLAFDAAYNVNTRAGNPPDSVRVEISKDAGVSWQPVNLGVRLDAGVSGGGASPSWVASSSLSRFSSNLSGWAGSVVNLRFRVVTTTEAGFLHCANGPTCPPPTSAGLGGFWVDNIRISGTSTGGLYPGADEPQPGPQGEARGASGWEPDGLPATATAPRPGDQSSLRAPGSGVEGAPDISAQASYVLQGLQTLAGVAAPLGGTAWVLRMRREEKRSSRAQGD